MKSSRSSSDRARRAGTAGPGPGVLPPAAVVALAAILAGVGDGGATAEAPAPSPAAATAATPPSATTPGATAPAAMAPDAPRRTCPRCGYRGDADWRYCALCGWDLSILAGSEAGDLLSAIGRATVGVIAVHEDPGLRELLPPQMRKYITQLDRRVKGGPARHKVFGTAFPISATGVFLTTSNLLDNVGEVSVRTFDNRLHPATVLAFDPASGLGALRADTTGAALIETAPDGAPPESGWVFCYPVAIEEGVARHLPLSIHAGRVTATGHSGRFVAAFEDLWRTDQAVPHGCEGGLFVDARGRAGGIVVEGKEAGLTWIQALGPLRRATEALARGAIPDWPFYGFGLVAVDDLRRRRFGLTADESHPVVQFLIPDTPAQAAGLQPGDVLTAVDGEAIDSLTAATRFLTRASSGGPAVRLTVLRRGVVQEFAVVPARRPANIMLDPVDELAEGLEATLEEVTTGPTSRQGLRIVALAAGGRGAEEGYAVGDVILAVDSKRIRTFVTFSRAVRDENRHLFPDRELAVEKHRRASTYFLGLDVRPAAGADDSRLYVNYFPDRLTAPVY
jgi:S1-C subfamily serine protease